MNLYRVTYRIYYGNVIKDVTLDKQNLDYFDIKDATDILKYKFANHSVSYDNGYIQHTIVIDADKFLIDDPKNQGSHALIPHIKQELRNINIKEIIS